jgi:hypothetical protein
LNPQGGDNTVFIDDVALTDVNPISDSSFELPALAPNTSQNSPAGSPWQFAAGTGIASNGSSLTSGNPNAPDGSQVAFVQNSGSMSQSVYLGAGSYVLSFLAAQCAGQTQYQQLQVLVDGVQVGMVIPSGTSYASYQTSSFTVTAGMYTVQIVGLNPQGGSNTAFLDEMAIADANPISDGTFAVPTLGAETFEYAATGSPWVFSAAAGVSSNLSLFTSANPNSPDGSQVAFLQEGGSMSESVYLNPGSYSLSFQAAQRSMYQKGSMSFAACDQEIAVVVDNVTVATITPIGINYGLYETPSFPITTAAMHTIELVGLNPHGGDNTAFIDDVAIADANPISDGSFALPSLAARTYQYTPNGPSSPWQFGAGTGVSSYGSSFTANNPNAPDGSQVGFIQGGGSMSQSVYLSAGAYSLSLLAAQRANCQTHYQEIEVWVDSTSVGTFTPNSTSYGAYQTPNFLVTAGVHVIKFLGLNPQGGDNTVFIDEVAITAANLVSDSSFDVPGLAANSYQYSPDGSSWLFGAGTGVSSSGSAFTSGNPIAPDGSQVAFIQGGGSMSQSVYLSAGTYSLSLVAAQRASQKQYEEIEVWVDNVEVGTIDPNSIYYGSYQMPSFAVATTAMHTIRFVGLSPLGGDNSVFIDDVQVLLV